MASYKLTRYCLLSGHNTCDLLINLYVTLNNFLLRSVLMSRISATCPQVIMSSFFLELLKTGPKHSPNSPATSFNVGSVI